MKTKEKSPQQQALLKNNFLPSGTKNRKSISHFDYEIKRRKPKIVNLWKKKFAVTGMCPDLLDPSIIHINIKTNFKPEQIKQLLEGLGYEVMNIYPESGHITVDLFTEKGGGA